jgi:N-ethylmaleimide reductase
MAQAFGTLSGFKGNANVTSLYDPLTLGDLELRNRVFMAPLTRNRARPDGVPGIWASTYYRQRTSAGLIVSEATQISPIGKGYINTPGIHSAEQMFAWKPIVEAVHSAGGRIFLQLWHVGRISHSSLLPGAVLPVAPSAIRAKSKTVVDTGFIDVSEPRALTLDEIKGTIDDYRTAAANARSAGFDGVEIHAANGYLIDQFLQSRSNVRTDRYGGSVSNRIRFLIEVAQAVLEVWDRSRVGVRISPRGTFNDMGDEDPEATFSAAVSELAGLRIGYLHVVEASPGDGPAAPEFCSLFRRLRREWRGVYIANGGYDGRSAEQAIRDGTADAIAFGRAFIANPDLPKRLEQRAPVNEPDPATFYGGTERGYIDYPAWDESIAVMGP